MNTPTFASATAATTGSGLVTIFVTGYAKRHGYEVSGDEALAVAALISAPLHVIGQIVMAGLNRVLIKIASPETPSTPAAGN